MGNNGGAASTEEPAGTSNSEYTAGDSYVWKYMYTLTTTQITDFLTADFMPVLTNATVSGAATDGAVTQYKVMRGGAGYTPASGTTAYTAVPITGDGASAVATVTVTDAGGSQSVHESHVSVLLPSCSHTLFPQDQ